MRFQVPQFIEVEDKIFGSLTFKQFIYLAGGGGLCVLLFTFLPKFLAFIISIPIAVFSLALAFYKMNGKPFIDIFESLLRFYTGHKLYIWKKVDKKPVHKEEAHQALDQVAVPKLNQSKLKDLTWSLDIQENQNPATPPTAEKSRV